jgi:hypothetical protein
MGMMLRRNNRQPDYAPQVNGQAVKSEPKKRSLTTPQPTPYNPNKSNGK